MRIERRDFLKTVAAAGTLAAIRSVQGSAIDREALLNRHNPIAGRLDPFSPLSLGNGQFAFTADVTGLQTFPEAYENSMPLCTMSQWQWHTTPLPGLGSIESLSTCS